MIDHSQVSNLLRQAQIFLRTQKLTSSLYSLLRSFSDDVRLVQYTYALLHGPLDLLDVTLWDEISSIESKLAALTLAQWYIHDHFPVMQVVPGGKIYLNV